MKYMIATANSSVKLETLVQELMDKHGWEPLGGHAVAHWEEWEGFLSIVQRFEYSQVLINQGDR